MTAARERATRAYAEYGRELRRAADLCQAREAYERFGAALPVPRGVDRQIGEADGVPVEWLTGGDGSSVVLFLHGGGYSSGSLGTHRALGARLALATGGRVLAVDYRRAPEHPFPAAVDDAVAAYRRLLDDGLPAAAIVIAGDSAGGGLALAVLLALRERAVPLPAAAVGIGPWVDLTVDGVGDDPVVTAAGLRRAAASYLGSADPREPLASPLFGDLRGLPPILLQVAPDEALAGDARRFAEKADRAGVQVSLEEWEGMVHGWHQYAAFLPEAVEAINRIAAFVAERTKR